MKQKRKHRNPKTKISGIVHQVNKTKVVPMVWATARRLANGDARRIQIIKSDVVVVHNNADWKKFIAKG